MANEQILASQQTAKKHYASQKTRRIVADVIVYIILTVMAIVWVLPILWIVLQSFSGEIGYDSMGRWVPQIWDWEVQEGKAIWFDGNVRVFTYTLGPFGNYRMLFTNQVWSPEKGLEASVYNFFGYAKDGQFYPGGFINTLIIAIFGAIISTLMTLMTSYAFSRLRFKGRTFMMKLIMILGMFPGFLGLVVLYALFYKVFQWDRSIWLLILIYSGGAGMGYYISKGFFDTISKQIDEAAMIDGATKFQIFYKITLPLSKPIITYTVLTSFMSPWAEYITANYMLGGQNNDKTNWTLPLILYKMLNAGELSDRPRYWAQFCAGAVIIAIPTSILFMSMQKNYVGGVTGGAVKG